MFKSLFLIGLLLGCFQLNPQEYDAIDTKVKNYPDFSSIEALSIRIKNDFEENGDRVRAAFVWLTATIDYQRNLDNLFASNPPLIYFSQNGKKYQINKHNLKLIRRAFKEKKGVCKDYSLLLDFLCKEFDVPSKIIYGVAKTDIKDVEGKRLVKTHTWNAVELEGEWQLMDPTWASGHFDWGSQKFVKNFAEHFYFTAPDAFIKDHFPSEVAWQLLEEPVKLSTFFSAPIFFPDYFRNRLKLAPETKGTIVLMEKNRSFLKFSQLADNKEVYYKIHGDDQLRKMRFRKESNGFVSRIKLPKGLEEEPYLTIFIENKAVLNFKLKQQTIDPVGS